MLASVGRLFRRGRRPHGPRWLRCNDLRASFSPVHPGRVPIAGSSQHLPDLSLVYLESLPAAGSKGASIHRRDFLIDAPAIKNARNSRENNTIIFSNRPKSACLRAHFAPLASLLSNRFSPLAIFLIASGSNIKNRPNSLTTNEKTFSNR